MDRKENASIGPWSKQEDNDEFFYYNDYYDGPECKALKEHGFTDDEIREIEEQTREKRLAEQANKENEDTTSEFYELMHEKTKEKARELIIDFMKSEYGIEDSDLKGDLVPLAMAADLSARVLAIVQELDKAIELDAGTYESLYGDLFPYWVTEEIIKVLMDYEMVDYCYIDEDDIGEPEPPEDWEMK